MILRLLTERHLEFASLKVGCTGSSESIRVKIPHCWKSHVTAQLCIPYAQMPLIYTHADISNDALQYCYALPVSQMSCSLASICIDDPRTLTSVCDCGYRGHTVS